MTDSRAPRKPAPPPEPLPTLVPAEALKPAPGPAKKEEPKKKPRRWPRILAWTGGIAAALAVVALLATPPIVSSVAKGKIVDALNASLNGTAEIGEFSFSWPASVRLGNIVAKDAKGDVAFSAREIVADAALFSALGGSYIVDARIDEPVIVVRQEGDGFNVTKLLKAPRAETGGAASGGAHAKAGDRLPDVRATLAVTKGRVSFVNARGARSEFTDVSAKVVVDSLEKPIVFEAVAAGASTLEVKGQVTVTKDGRLDVDRLHGPVSCRLDDVHLSNLLAAASAFAPVTRLDGVLNGSASLQLTSMTSGKGAVDLRLSDVAADGDAVGGRPIALKRLDVNAVFDLDPAGTGPQKLTLEAGDFLTVRVDGTTQDVLKDNGRVTARVTIDGALRGLSESLGPLLRLKPGTSLGGTAKVAADVEAVAGRAGLGPVSAVVDAALADLSATNEKGEPLPLDPTATLTLNGAWDPKGTAKIDACELRAGTVTVSAGGGADLAARSFRDSFLKIDADLDDVAKKVKSFVELDFTFGGKVHVDASLAGSGDAAKSSAKVTVTRLRLENVMGRNLGPIDLTLTQAGTVDFRPGAKSVLEHFELVSGLVDIQAKGEAVDALDPAKASGTASLSLRAFPAAITAKLGAFLEGYSLAGADLEVAADASFAGRRVAAKGRVRAPDVVVRGPALGEAGASLNGVAASFGAACDTTTMDGDLQEFRLTVGSASVSLKDIDGPATVTNASVSLTGSKQGDRVSARGDVRLAGAEARGPGLGPKGAVVRDVALAADAALDLKTFDAESRDATLTCGSADAWIGDAARPVSARGVVLKLSGARRGDDVEIARLELASNLASGGGSAKATSLMKEGMSASGRLEFRGDVAPLVEIAKAFWPELQDAKAAGAWEAVLPAESKGREFVLTPRVAVSRLTLTGMKVAEKALDVKDADLVFEARAAVAADGGGKATVERCSLTAPGADLKATGNASGFLASPMKLAGGFHVEARVQPDEMTRRLSAFLFGYALAGAPVEAVADLGSSGDLYLAKGRLTAKSLRVTMPPEPKAEPRVVTQEDVVAEFDVDCDLKAESIAIRTGTYASRTARASCSGSVRGFTKMTADLAVSADAELARVMADLSAFLPAAMKDYDLRGKGTAKVDVKGDAGKLKATGAASIDGFAVTVPGARPAEKVTVTDPKVSLTADADVETEYWDAVLNSAALESGFLRGSASGAIKDCLKEPSFHRLTGEFTYVPDKLGAVIRPWLYGGALSGAQEQKAAFTLDGRMKDFDPLALLRSSSAEGTAGIGLFTWTGLAMRGDVKVDLRTSKATATSRLDVNEGVTDLTAVVDLRQQDDATSTCRATLSKVGANAQMSPLLQNLHPLFSIAEGTVDGLVQGRIDCALEVSYRGEITMDLVTWKAGWAGVEKTRIDGKGHFEITGFGLKGSPFLGELLAALEIEKREEIELNPIDFTIRRGRLSYDRPMKMKLSGQQTFWTGSIGLDHDSAKCLDLWWEIPVTDRLVKKHSFLKYWAGKTITVHVTGRATSPRLEWKELLADLAAKAAQKAIEEKGQDLLEGLLGKEEKEAKKLLAEADRLYDEGKTKEAAALYQKLHSEYRKTGVYRDNKDRIKAREQ